MTETIWKLIVDAIKSLINSPPWLLENANLTFDEVLKLPRLGAEVDGTIAQPNLTHDVIEADYLDFLREQIRLGARGPEWNRILQQRLDNLQPFLNKKVLIVNLYRKPYAVTLYIDPETQNLFHVES